MTLSFFPEVYPDELLYSTFARYHKFLRHRTDQHTQRDLFGSLGVRGSIDLPSHLDALMDRLPRGHPYRVESLIKGHTTLPYYSRFIPAERTAHVIRLMRGRRGDLTRRLLGLTTFRCPTRPFLMVCEACAASDHARYGEYYWHRCHQLPGVFVCAVHGAVLLKTAIPLGQRMRHGLFRHLSEELLTAARPVNTPSLPDSCLASLATDTAWVLMNWDTTYDLAELQERYRLLLDHGGWLYPDGRIRTADLSEAILQHYSEDGLDELSCSLVGRPAPLLNYGHWLHRLLIATRRTQHPLHHLLAVRFLGSSVQSFFAPGASLGEPLPVRIPTASEEIVAGVSAAGACRMKGSSALIETPETARATVVTSPPCRNPLCPRFAPELVDSKRLPLLVACSVCGFTYRPYRSSPLRYRIVRPGALWEARLRELAVDRTITASAIAARLGVGLTTIQCHAARLGVWRKEWRVRLSFNPSAPSQIRPGSIIGETRKNHRSTILAIRREHRRANRSEIRALAASAYEWLIRHDRQWMEKNLPAKRGFLATGSPCDWLQRDRELLALARAAVTEMRAAPGKPKRISTRAIGLRVGHLPLLTQRQDKLPQTAAFLASVTETYESATRRRIGWAVAQFVSEGVRPSENMLAVRAGLGWRYRRLRALEISAACDEINGRLR